MGTHDHVFAVIVFYLFIIIIIIIIICFIWSIIMDIGSDWLSHSMVYLKCIYRHDICISYLLRNTT